MVVSNTTKCYMSRNSLSLSRREFALLLGVSRKTVENWEIIKTKPAPKHTEIIFDFITHHKKQAIMVLSAVLFSKEYEDLVSVYEVSELMCKLLTEEEMRNFLANEISSNISCSL